ncbi:hypothetical protein B0H17DRAFT_1140074 [Mycena rosella]|uniref:F-box domain-containing protein n=1 Tax=Mycena rosella TaxID=1033263 RepID=A0AAD7D2U2_MYCRO|nr:hypothetical protein B0H17DRAFT_1140074 [Mycena rosella]
MAEQAPLTQTCLIWGDEDRDEENHTRLAIWPYIEYSDLRGRHAASGISSVLSGVAGIGQAHHHSAHRTYASTATKREDWSLDWFFEDFDTPPVDSNHNEKLPIARLPPELLAEVFILLCETCGLSDYSWVACSYVSSSWRQISLGIPYLWGHVVFTSPAWSRLCIERSKSAPLIIEANMSCQLIQDLVCDALELAYRVARVTLRFFALSERSSKLLAGPFPKLTSLSIESTSFWEAPHIPAHADAQHYPRLQDLMIRTKLGFLPPLPVQLVSLEIDTVDMHDLGWEIFADALQILRELEVLRLRGFPVPSASSASRQISLPSLRHLNLSASPASCSQFIQLVQCSHAPRYDLDLWNVSGTTVLLQTVQANFVNPPKSMFLHRIDFTQVVFGFVYEDTRHRRAVSPDICFVWQMPLSDSELAEIFAAISEIAVLGGIQWFLLADWNIIPHGSWSALLKRLVGLQSLVVCGRPASGLFWDLIKHLEGEGADGTLVPDLTEIELSHVDCSAGGWLMRRPRVNACFDLDGARFLEVLVYYLELRTTRLAKLKVNQCSNYTGAEIKLLRRLVADVEWDGAGLIPPSYYPNGDEFGALTIDHNLLSRRPGYEELNLSDDERWCRQNWAHLGRHYIITFLSRFALFLAVVLVWNFGP